MAKRDENKATKNLGHIQQRQNKQRKEERHQQRGNISTCVVKTGVCGSSYTWTSGHQAADRRGRIKMVARRRTRSGVATSSYFHKMLHGRLRHARRVCGGRSSRIERAACVRALDINSARISDVVKISIGDTGTLLTACINAALHFFAKTRWAWQRAVACKRAYQRAARFGDSGGGRRLARVCSGWHSTRVSRAGVYCLRI
jgi:hypothetical protein